jgi:NAD(P)-dependent dehydrogenase (short-subunit alcohol dehydrogenase family)
MKLVARLTFLLLPPAFAELCISPLSSSKLVADRGYNLQGKVAVITGISWDNIAYAGAVALARAGATLYLLGHRAGKSAAIAAKITQLTGNGDVTGMVADHAKFSSVRMAAAAILEHTSHVDVLIHNAGLNGGLVELPLSDDGFEVTWQVSMLSAALLTELLLPALRSAHGRVISVSSANVEHIDISLKLGMPMGIDDLLVRTPLLGDSGGGAFLCFAIAQPSDCMCPSKLRVMTRASALPAWVMGGLRTYVAFAMLAKNYWTYELDRREKALGSGVTAYVWSPGFVATPAVSKMNADIGYEMSSVCATTPWYLCLCTNTSRPGYFDAAVCEGGGISPDQGAAPLAYMSAAPLEELEPLRGVQSIACERVEYEDFRLTMAHDHGEEFAASYSAALFDAVLRDATGSASSFDPGRQLESAQCTATLSGSLANLWWPDLRAKIVRWTLVLLALVTGCCRLICCCCCCHKRSVTVVASSSTGMF